MGLNSSTHNVILCPMIPDIRTASCACGQLRLECSGGPSKVSVCHCLDCQRRTGSAFGIAAFYSSDKVKITGSANLYARGSDSGFEVVHHFCPQCGSTVFWYPTRKLDSVAVGVGCFADPSFPTPDQQVYEHHRYSWVSVATR